MDDSAFTSNFLDQTEFKLLEVPQAAVYQLGRPAACARGEVVLLHQGNLKSARHGIQRDTGTRDTAANDKKIKRFRTKAVYQLIPESK
jgi:hypothetical protein